MAAAQKVIKVTDQLVNIVIGMILLIILLYGGYALWDTYMVYQKTDVSDEIEHFKPTRENPNLDDLRKINPDVCAWLTLDDTNIDYPVVQGEDNMEYLNQDLYGEYSLGGSIFLDNTNQPDFSDFYSLLYGHHMDGGAMFGDLKKFEDPEFFDSHMTGWLMTSGKTFELEIYACMTVDAYDVYMFTPGVPDEKDRQALIQYIQDEALNYRNKDVSTYDQIIALSTCSSATTNGRTIVVARLVEYTKAGGE